MPRKKTHKVQVKLTINPLVRGNAEPLASARGMSLSELIECLIVDEMRLRGLDPWKESGPVYAAPSEAPAKSTGKKPQK